VGLLKETVEDMLKNANVAHAEVVGAAVVGIEEGACFDLWGCYD